MASNTIGNYRLIAKLGRGGNTEVFLALRGQPTGVNELCVVKRLREDAAADGDYEAVWPLAEGQVATRLQHPNIVETYEVGNDGVLPFRVLEYLECQPLDRVLAAANRSGGLAVSCTLQIIDDLLAALDYAHDFAEGPEGGVIHGNVHPHNVFVTYQGEGKLADFGAAQPKLDHSDPTVLERNLKYMAPERALGLGIDRRSDIFAVGVVMWEALAMRSLVTAADPNAKGEQLLVDSLPRLASVRPDLDRGLVAICDRALDPDPELRYPSARAMREDLAALLNEASTQRAPLASFMQSAFANERRTRETQIERLTANSLTFQRATRTSLEALNPAPKLRPTLPPSLATAAPTLQKTDDSGNHDRTRPSVLLRPDSMPSERPQAPTKTHRATVAAIAFAGLAFTFALLWLFAPGKQNEPEATRPLPTAAAATPAPEAEIVLRLCGSNTIGDELAPALVEAFLTFKAGGTPTRKRDAAAELTTITLANSNAGKPIGVEIRARGSATAFSGLEDGTCDIGMASRPVEETEVSALVAGGHGDVRANGSEHVIALDGIAVIVHPSNPLQALDRTALHDIYTGKTQDWSAVGGSAGPINVLARDAKSGTFDTFKHLVLGKDELVGSAKRFAQSTALADAAASDPAAIGFVGLPYVRSAKALAVGAPGAAPMLPTRFTVATEGYMLSRRLYFYTLPTPRTPWVTELVSFALSRHGQEVVAKSQFVDLRLTTRTIPCDAHCPARYAAAVARAQRVSVDFRFRSGSNTPDSRAGRDVDRFVSFLAEQPHRDAKVLLLGFSDATGNAAANEALSLKRAKAIQEELALRGVPAAIAKGFGSAMPVAGNESESGRLRNRRVEIWLEN